MVNMLYYAFTNFVLIIVEKQRSYGFIRSSAGPDHMDTINCNHVIVKMAND